MSVSILIDLQRLGVLVGEQFAEETENKRQPLGDAGAHRKQIAATFRPNAPQGSFDACVVMAQ